MISFSIKSSIFNDHWYIGGLGDDQFYDGGGDGANIYIYSSGDGSDEYHDWDGLGQDTIKFTDIASTDVSLSKLYGSLIFSFADTNDQISFIDQFYGEGRMDFFEFSDGVIWDENDIDSMLSTASEGNDFLYGNNDDNVLSGLGGNDEVYGEGGNDVLNGGTGNDLLSGDYGDDTYIFNTGSGKDEIIDSDGEDSIQFGEGITASDLSITYSLDSIIIIVNSDDGENDEILISNSYLNNTIEKLVFDNGDVVLWDPVEKIYDNEDIGTVITPHDYDNVMYDKGGESGIMGTDGNDLFIGRSGWIQYFIGDSGGHDVIKDWSNLAPYSIATGEDARGLLYLSDITDDRISAIRDGDDLVLIIDDGEAQSIRIVDQFIGLGVKTILVKDANSINPNEVVKYWFDIGSKSPYWEYGDYQIYNMAFDALFGPRVFVPQFIGTDASETIEGTDGNDIIDGGKGDDHLSGGKGDDTYNYDLSDGNDTISDSEGSNRVRFGEGITKDGVTVTANGNHFTVHVTDGAEVVIQAGDLDDVNVINFRFSDGTTWDSSDIWANTVAVGTGDDDNMDYKTLVSGTTYNSGLGNDSVYGGQGDDAYLFSPGDGQDIFSDSNGTDKIIFGEGITAENLRITHDDTESHWIVELLGSNGELTGDKITVENAYITQTETETISSVEGELQDSFLIESFEFFDGTSMALAEIQRAAGTLYTELEQEVVTEVEGTSGDDELVGDELVNVINGYAGNDTLTGGLGNDTLIGGSDDDVYLYNLGDGNDTINDYSGTDTLRFGAGITADNISIGANETDMLITLSDGQVVTITNWYSSNTSRIEKFEFADGTTWQAADVLANMVIAGTDGDDTISNKYLLHSTNYDMGVGNDSVYGGKGDDTYLYNLGDGNDTINDYSGTDTLRFGAGITADN
ncbi:MAG: hypothetical protein GY928_03885, partial [Colwellia sp.]|nr:hypothetical protein [Colwellia sp.]